MNVSEKTRDTIFARMKDLDFFEDDWLSKDSRRYDDEDRIAAILRRMLWDYPY